MDVYRIVRKKYSKDLSGLGARMFGGRWNSKGVAVVYSAESISLAAFELAVHTPLTLMPKDLIMMRISLPKIRNMQYVELDNLPKKWDKHPPIKKTQKMGDEFVQANEALLLRVPSAVIPNEFNYLINPTHTLMAKVKITATRPFQFDSRLFFK